MNPEQGQLVQIRFYNGYFFDAVIQEWSDQKSKVKLIGSGDIVIIQKTLQDVLAIQIMTSKQPAQAPVVSTPTTTLQAAAPIAKVPPRTLGDINEEFLDHHNQPVTPDRLKRMSELKDEMNKLEREDAFKKLRTFESTGVRSVQYGIPRNLQVCSATQYTKQEAAPTDSTFYSEMQGLFSKKH